MSRHDRPGWREALARGNHQAAVFRRLLEEAGRRYSLWDGNISENLAAVAAPFCRAHGLDPELATIRGRPIRSASHYIAKQWLVHLAHFAFGRPRHTPFREWDMETREQHYVGLTEGQRQLTDRLARDAVYARWGSAIERRHADDRRDIARAMRGDGYPNAAIAERLGCEVRSVRRLLQGQSE